MESAPVNVVTTNAGTFIPTSASKYPGFFTHSSTRVPRPVFAFHVIAGTVSADDTGFRWSKQAHKALWIQAQVDPDDPVDPVDPEGPEGRCWIDETIPARGGSESIGRWDGRKVIALIHDWVGDYFGRLGDDSSAPPRRDKSWHLASAGFERGHTD